MKQLVISGIVGLIISMNVFAQDETVEINGSKIVVTGSELPGLFFTSNADKYNASEFKNGIYIVVNNGFVMGSLDNRMNAAENLVSNIFRNKGFKITDKYETADAVFGFGVTGSLSVVDANNRAASSALPNRAQVVGVGGQIVNGVLTNGVAGLVGAAAVLIYNPDSKLMINGLVHKSPIVISKGWVGNGVYGNKDGKIESSFLEVSYKLEKNNPAPADAILEMAVDQWIKKFIVFDTESEAKPAMPNGADSAVANADALSDQSK